MKKLHLLFFVCFFSFGSFGQRIKLVSGDASVLRNQSSINFEFTYDSIRVENSTEKEYVERTKADLNKKPGKGDEWESEWYSKRKEVYEPRFIESFASAGFTANKSAEYTLIFKTKFIETGLIQGYGSYSAYMDGTALLVSTNEKDKVIAKWTIGAAPGKNAGGFAVLFGRIRECYATAGKRLGRFIADGLGK